MACAIDSLVEQGYSNLEIIISDNGSTDATPDKFNSDAGLLSNEPQIYPPCDCLV
jgi:glycosyltransferase involved in cell wall biosynthesis